MWNEEKKKLHVIGNCDSVARIIRNMPSARSTLFTIYHIYIDIFHTNTTDQSHNIY